jgi:ankyrin repeat protein
MDHNNSDDNHRFFTAIEEEDYEVVSELVDDEVVGELITDENFKNYKGETPLIVAIKTGNYGIVELLLEYGANPNIQDSDGNFPFNLALENREFDIAELLFIRNTDINMDLRDDDKNKKYLVLLSGYGFLNLVKLLIQKGVSQDARDRYGNSPLIAAASQGNYFIVKFLIENGAELNVQNINGETALMHAAKKGHFKNFKILLDSGADPNIKDNKGKVAYEMTDNREIKSLLRPDIKHKTKDKEKIAKCIERNDIFTLDSVNKLDEVFSIQIGDAYYCFSESEIIMIQKILNENDYNTGIRGALGRSGLQIPKIDEVFHLLNEIMLIDL